jgi:transposase
MMLLIGCDYHPSVQQIAMLDTETGDYSEHRLKHSDGEAEKFYRDLKLHTPKIRVGLEATGHRRWFERLLMELDCELWVGDAARIATMRVQSRKRIGKTPSFC